MKQIMATAIALLIIVILLLPLAGTLASGEERSRTDERSGEDERNEGDERDNGDEGNERGESDDGEETDRRRGLGNPPPQPNDNDEPRVLSYSITNNSVTVVSSGRTDGDANSFYFTAELNRGIVLHYSYFRESASNELGELHRQFSENRSFQTTYRSPGRNSSSDSQNSSLSSEDLGLSLAFVRMREVNETGSELSSKDLSRVRYARPVVRILGPEANPSDLIIHIGTTDGLFGLTVGIHSNYTSDENGIVGPLEVKFALTIRDYNFTGNDSFLVLETSLDMPNAELGLFSRELIQQNGGLDGGTDGQAESERTFEEDGVGYEKDGASLFMSWATNVTVDRGEHNVTARYTRTLGRDQQFMDTVNFIFPAGSVIHHDPKLGVSEQIYSTEDATTSTAELLLTWSTGLVAGIATIFAIGRKLKPPKYHWEE